MRDYGAAARPSLADSAAFHTQVLRVGDAVGFLLAQNGVEIPISGLPLPVRLTVPLADAGALACHIAYSTCALGSRRNPRGALVPTVI